MRTLHTRDMTQGRPLRLILSVAFPLMIGNIFQQLYTVVDAQIVGSVDGVHALAALGAADWFNFLFLGIVQGLAQGFAIPMAHAFGAQDMPQLRRCVGNAVILAAVLGIAVALCAQVLVSPVLTLLGTRQELFGMARLYLRILFSGFPLVMGFNLSAGILRSLGDGRSPLYAMMVASGVNISLDLLFVAVFRWSVAGAAAATVIAQGASFLFCLYRLSRLSFLRPGREDLRLQRSVWTRLVSMGLPIAAQNAIIGAGGMAVQSIVNTMDVAFIAGYTATNKLYGVLEIAAISCGYAVSTYAGQNLGAGKLGRIRRGVFQAAIMSVAIAMVTAGVMFLVGRPIIGGFLSGSEAEVSAASAYGCEFLYLMSMFLPVLYLLHNYRSALQGMGCALMPMVSGIFELIMRVGSAAFLPGILGYQGLFIAEVLAWAGADLVLLPSYYLFLRHFGGGHLPPSRGE